MINSLRHEACSGSIDDLAHVSSADCLADCLTKSSAKPDALIKAVTTSTLPNVDMHPPFRDMMKYKHKAYHARGDVLASWIMNNVPGGREVIELLGVSMRERIAAYLKEI